MQARFRPSLYSDSDLARRNFSLFGGSEPDQGPSLDTDSGYLEPVKQGMSGEETASAVTGIASSVMGLFGTIASTAAQATEAKRGREHELKMLTKEKKLLKEQQKALAIQAQVEAAEAAQAKAGMGTTVLLAGSILVLGFGGIGVYTITQKKKRERGALARENPFPLLLIPVIVSLVGAGIGVGHQVIQKNKAEKHAKKIRELQKKVDKEQAEVDELQALVAEADAIEQEAESTKTILLGGTLITLGLAAGVAFLANRKKSSSIQERESL